MRGCRSGREVWQWQGESRERGREAGGREARRKGETKTDRETDREERERGWRGSGSPSRGEGERGSLKTRAGPWRWQGVVSISRGPARKRSMYEAAIAAGLAAKNPN
ncbi:hypothetical protein ACLOJK_041460, partial [Asimina triloba]